MPQSSEGLFIIVEYPCPSQDMCEIIKSSKGYDKGRPHLKGLV